MGVDHPPVWGDDGSEPLAGQHSLSQSVELYS